MLHKDRKCMFCALWYTQQLAQNILNEWLNAWIGEWVNKCMDAWMNSECMNECEVKRACTHKYTLPHYTVHRGFWFGTIRRTTLYFGYNIILHRDIFFHHDTGLENEVICFRRGGGVWAPLLVWLMSTSSFFLLLPKICLFEFRSSLLHLTSCCISGGRWWTPGLIITLDFICGFYTHILSSS